MQIERSHFSSIVDAIKRINPTLDPNEQQCQLEILQEQAVKKYRIVAPKECAPHPKGDLWAWAEVSVRFARDHGVTHPDRVASDVDDAGLWRSCPERIGAWIEHAIEVVECMRKRVPPSDLITFAVAARDFNVAEATLNRAVADGRLTSWQQRPKHLISREQVASNWPSR